jgi:hypothetical protein
MTKFGPVDTDLERSQGTSGFGPRIGDAIMTRHLVTTLLVRARSTPDSLEAATDYACVMDGMSGVAVAQVILDQR